MNEEFQNKTIQQLRQEAEEEILGIIESLKGKVTDHSVIPSLQRLITRLQAGEVSPKDALAIARSVKFPSMPQ